MKIGLSFEGVRKVLNTKRVLYIVLISCTVITVGVVSYFIITQEKGKNDSKSTNNQQNLSPPPATPEQAEKGGEAIAKRLVDKKDYATYQVYEIGIANLYLGSKEFDKALEATKRIRSVVPEDQISSKSYIVMIEVSKAQKDKEEQKKYIQKVIPLLQKEGRQAEVDEYQKELQAQ